MDPSEEEGILDPKLRTAFKIIKHRQKWMVSHLIFSDKSDALYSDFTLGEARVGSDGSYRAEVGMR